MGVNITMKMRKTQLDPQKIKVN